MRQGGQRQCTTVVLGQSITEADAAINFILFAWLICCGRCVLLQGLYMCACSERVIVVGPSADVMLTEIRQFHLNSPPHGHALPSLLSSMHVMYMLPGTRMMHDP